MASAFVCDVTRARIATRYFIPCRRDCTKGTGTFCDLNTAIQHLDERVARGDIKKETAERAEAWIMRALGLQMKIERAPHSSLLASKGVEWYRLQYQRLAPEGSGPCRETSDEFSRRVFLQTQQVGTASTGQPIYTKPNCSVQLRFNVKTPRDETTDWDLQNWRQMLQRRRIPCDHYMAAKLHSNGVTLYPGMGAHPADVAACADSAQLNISVCERTFP